MHRHNSAEGGGFIVSIMIRLRLDNSLKASIKNIIVLNFLRAQAMPKRTLNGALKS